MKQIKNNNAIKICNKTIGKDHPCFIIAEAGANFKISENAKNNYKQALKLIDIAAQAKADAVKFQLYRAEKIYTKNAGYADYLGKKKPIFDIIKEMELPYEWLPKLKKYCDKKKIIFLCTPFDEQSVDELEKIGIKAYKIASYTISHIPLLKYIAKKGKPMLLSTGASDLNDIKKALSTIRREGNNKIAILQCTAKYPAPMSSLNLLIIPEMIKKFNVPIGLSDHSREPYIGPIVAVTLGAKIIEKHYTTNNNLPGPDHGFAILPEELKHLVENVRMAEDSFGKSKKVVQSDEKELHKFCRRGIFAIKNIKKGERFTKENISALRPGKKKMHIPAENLETILKQSAKRDIKAGKALKKYDF
jgi:N-acetylneuraminate synthase